MTVESIDKTYAPQLAGLLTAASGDSSLRDMSVATEPWAKALILDAVGARATDVHFDSMPDKVRLRFRIDGTLHEVARLPFQRGPHLLRYFKVAAKLDPAPCVLPEDSRFPLLSGVTQLDIRVACAPCLFGDKLALRLLQRSSIKHRLHELGLQNEEHESVRRWLEDSSGMCLVTGPIGSGKTTTLYALLAELSLAKSNIVTIEDPVEYQLEHVNQIEVHPKRGLTFERGLRSALRLDADYILLGEIRDKESAITAMEAAGTGRVVMSTMHSRNAAGAVTALRSLGIPNYEIAASLAFVVGQRLIRKLCTHCRKQGSPSRIEQQWLASLGDTIPNQAWHPVGCSHCNQTGCFDRTGIFELLMVGERVYDMILAGEDEHALRQHLRTAGFRPLLRDGLAKAKEGITDYAELTRIGAQTYLDTSAHEH